MYQPARMVLTKEEEARRQKIKDAVEKARPGYGSFMEERIVGPEAAKEFPWGKPPLYGKPYSTVYLKAFFAAKFQNFEAAEKVQEKSKTQDIKGKGKAKKDEGESLVPRNPADVSGGSRLYGFYNERKPELTYHAPLAAKVALFEQLVSKPVLEGCGPFEISFGPGAATYVGNDERDVGEAIKYSSKVYGGTFGLVLLFVKYESGPAGENLVGAFLDWPAFVDTEDPAWRSMLYNAWCSLLQWHYDQLAGRRQTLVASVKKSYDAQFRRHLSLYCNIESVLYSIKNEAALRQKLAEQMEGESVEVERLLEWQAQQAIERGEAIAAERVDKKEKIADKIFELLAMIKDPAPLSPMGIDEEMRRLLVQRSAERVLGEALSEILGRPNCHLREKMGDVKEVFADLQSPWEEILPREVRKRMATDALWEYKSGRGDSIAGTIDKALVKWQASEESSQQLACDVESSTEE
ncbi:hypothetical protein Daesc_001299 [Daldinia eschscholtzii]|uniref:Uncharacterized protein n=1 Tax=Daldinia eschscholtzii TaxID=292717 RepID=A0AAX6N0T2_9PEZI